MWGTLTDIQLKRYFPNYEPSVVRGVLAKHYDEFEKINKMFNDKMFSLLEKQEMMKDFE